MLNTKNITVKWNPKTKKYYESLGYKYTKMGNPLVIDVNHLRDGSNERVECICDYCGRKYTVAWYSYISLKKKQNNKDCCSNPHCIGLKSKESMEILYGVSNCREIDSINEKIKKTNLSKYGCENPFSNEDIKNKIVESNIDKYGVKSPMQNVDVKKKAVDTCIKKYGVSNYGAIYSSTHKGELSPTWKGGVSHHREERATFEYRNWRKSVFSRDKYTCQCCDDKSSKGHAVELHAHHIENWKDNLDKRYDIDNGITLCDKCHYLFHSLYGKVNNSKEQLDSFLDIRKKLC